MPSTMLNVIDLISDWSDVVSRNDDISSPYMFYQLFNLVGSVIGPGSIFLMLIGAFSLAFGLSSNTSMILNIILLGSFIAACCTLKSAQQIMFAQVGHNQLDCVRIWISISIFLSKIMILEGCDINLC